ncbi:MAG: redox-regulated ATPase YchF [Spirochaetes bacterium]|nr:redox-regulated ATPase YchF [Spirochaetota bacterium]
MKIGILGLPQSGRRTVYGLLTGSKPPAEGEGKGPVVGVAPILDPRFDDLVARYRPKKETRARFTLELLPALEENAVREGAVFSDIAGTDALLLVVREFGDDRVYHPKGSVDAARDVDAVVSELLLHDLIFIEKRLERIAEGKRRGRDERTEKEEHLMIKMRERLEGDLPLRTMELGDEERKLVSGYPLITMKELVIALNAGEGDMKGSGSVGTIGRKYEGHGVTIARLSARLEAEIAALDSPAERAEFMRESGIEEPALSLLTRSCMAALGLQSFFTVGEDEVRQWLILRGATAPEAAAAIHSDIQRGFIRAEVTKYGDLVALGSEDAVKKAGKALVMGRDYVVEDGDIISFRFNV